MKRLMIALALITGGCASVTPVAPPDGAVTPAPAATPPSPPVPVPVPSSTPAVTESKPLTWTQVATINDERLIDIFPGMNRKVVEERMQLHSAGRPVNPFRQEILRDRQGRIYHVQFYLTREPIRGRAINERFLTPVIFTNDKVDAIGRYPLKKLRANACRLARGQCLPAS